jgi:hypothetical protein
VTGEEDEVNCSSWCVANAGEKKLGFTIRDSGLQIPDNPMPYHPNTQLPNQPVTVF